MAELNLLPGTRLPGGYMIVSLEIVAEPIVDAVGRVALARTEISGRELRMTIVAGQSIEELSVSIYHEVLEAMTVAVLKAPESVSEFNEGDFERAAYDAYDKLGPPSPAAVIEMLQNYGFRGE